MVAPLDVEVVIVAQYIHDFVGTRSAVVYIAQDVQHVDGELLYEVAHGDDEVVGPLRRDDGAHHYVYIGLLVGVARVLVQQFLDDVGEVGRQGLVHFRPRVLRRHVAAHFHQTVDVDEIPVVEVASVGDAAFHKFQFQLRVVDERAQFFLFLGAQGLVEDLLHLALDSARGVAQHVLEGLVLSVQVGQEVLGAFGQV